MDDLTIEEFDAKGEEALKSNRRVIQMFEDKDGNWRGGLSKGGKFVQARQIGPETVLQLLLTHNGN